MASYFLTPGADDTTATQSDGTGPVSSSENNYIYFRPGLDLTSSDNIEGGTAAGFSDTLVATAGGTISASDFAGVSNVEALVLSSAGNNVVTLSNNLVTTSN